MNKFVKLIIGLLIVLVGVYIYVIWPGALGALYTLFKGSIALVIILIGILFLAIGITE